ncbi:MAG: nucleoside deaminase [Puniceicoccales bacterium]|jgi:tRNA(adenine34) deaminase|nr:nucleoside deaminase [Puniceicoccales bacterium]
MAGTLKEHDFEFMDVALEEARIAMAEDEVPVGAAIVYDGEVIAADHNRVRASCSALAHGEMLVLAAAAKKLGDWRLNGCTLYATKELCPMCAGACVMSRVSRVVFAVGDCAMGCLGGGPFDFSSVPMFNHRFPAVGGVRSDECLVLLREFFATKRIPRKDCSEGITSDQVKMLHKRLDKSANI